MPHESELCCFLLLLNIFFVCIIYKVTDFVVQKAGNFPWC